MQTGLGVLRMTPDEFWSLTMVEIVQACEGFSKFNGGQSDTPMTKEELQDLMERYPD